MCNGWNTVGTRAGKQVARGLTGVSEIGTMGRHRMRAELGVHGCLYRLLSTEPSRPLCGSLGATGLPQEHPPLPTTPGHGKPLWQGLPRVGLTVVSSQEGGLVYIVLGMEGLSVQDCGRGDLPIGRVDVQPVGGIRQF